MVITVDCPSCATSFPVDTNKVPVGGVNARCSECRAIFRVERPEESVAEPAAPPVPAVEPEAVAEPEVAEPTPVRPEAEPEVAEPTSAQPEAEPELAEPEPAEPTHAGTFEEATREALEHALEAEEPAPTHGMEEIDYESAGAAASTGAYGIAGALEEVLEEEPEEEPEAAAPEETPALPEGSDWGALRELLEGVDDVVTEEPEAGADEEAPVAEARPVPGEIHVADVAGEAVTEAGVEEAHAFEDETADEAPEGVETEVETAGTSAAGTEVVWDVDREVEEAAEQAATAASPGWFTFGRQDPDDKARRLARVLVSDMVMYNPERHDRALNNGTLKEDFEEEIRKSWREYVEQVGEEMATGTTYWSEALNELLAKGQQIF